MRPIPFKRGAWLAVLWLGAGTWAALLAFARTKTSIANVLELESGRSMEQANGRVWRGAGTAKPRVCDRTPGAVDACWTA